MFLFPFLLGDKAENLQMAVTVSAVLRLGDGVGTSLAVVLGHILTLLEGSRLILQNMPDTESIAIESALLAQLWAVRAQRLIVHL